ncbi:hypothetical protein PO124_24070 [Bacillus licheniformis]|nr:hypothetical protein [Bacillus licheniformis]
MERKWNNAVTWAQNTWDGAVSVWESITGTIKDTVLMETGGVNNGTTQ